MTLSTVKTLILTSQDLDTIRKQRDQAPKQTEKETNPKSYAETIKGDKRYTRKITRTLPPPKRFRFQNQQ
jgi:hypothetical protein